MHSRIRRVLTVTTAALAISVLATPALAHERYEVSPGDTLSEIAGDHDVSWQAIAADNDNIDDPDLILPGQVLRIPEPGTVPASTTGDMTPDPTPDPTTTDAAQADAPAPSNAGVWDRLAACESGGDWSYNGSSGYDGGLQFHPDTWTAHGGGEFAPSAHQASRAEQIAVAERVLDAQGWGAWPACAAELGLG